jgi:hypothetical protein
MKDAEARANRRKRRDNCSFQKNLVRKSEEMANLRTKLAELIVTTNVRAGLAFSGDKLAIGHCADANHRFNNCPIGNTDISASTSLRLDEVSYVRMPKHTNGTASRFDRLHHLSEV